MLSSFLLIQNLQPSAGLLVCKFTGEIVAAFYPRSLRNSITTLPIKYRPAVQIHYTSPITYKPDFVFSQTLRLLTPYPKISSHLKRANKKTKRGEKTIEKEKKYPHWETIVLLYPSNPISKTNLNRQFPNLTALISRRSGFHHKP